MAQKVTIPNNWTPRSYQLPLWSYISGGGKRAVAVWHRRSGKDSTVLNLTCAEMFKRKGVYWHMLPEATQARKAVWDGIDQQERRIIDQVFPDVIRSKIIENEMKIELRNGSLWQLVGSDNYNRLVGANPVGVVFSEYSLADPAAWDYIRPILAQNNGWAIFCYTPRGRNHGHTLFEMAKANPEWFAECLTVNDTMIITPEQIAEERRSGMTDDMVQQEYFCSWEGIQIGSIYGECIKDARAQGRITAVPVDRRYPVHTYWDIGHGDACAVIAYQNVGVQDRFVNSYEAVGQDVPHFAQKLKEWGYYYGDHFIPHDAKNTTQAAKSNPLGKNVYDQLIMLGFRSVKIVPRTPDVWTAINATRARFGTCYFDEVNCGPLINALSSYHKQWDPARGCFLDLPYHDWSSNFADAFRQWGQSPAPGGNAGTFTLPGAVPVQAGRPVPRMVTVGNKRTGY